MKKVIIIGGVEIGKLHAQNIIKEEVKETTLIIKNYRNDIHEYISTWCDENHERVGKGGRARKRSKFKNK